MRRNARPARRLSITCLLFCLAAGATGGCDGGTPLTRPGQAGPQSTFGNDSSLVSTPVSGELGAVRGATARYHDLAVANADGYVIPAGEPCVAVPPLGVMGFHAPNLTLMADQDLDPLRPELLLYLPKPGGGLKLVGVEYFQNVLLRNLATGDVDTWISKDPWDPATYEVANPTPVLFGRSFDAYHAGHIESMAWHWDLHVWVWANNPSGMFAPFNPALTCG